MSNLAERLKLLRRRRGLTQRGLAARLDISYGAIANYEVGKREPDYDTLRQIASFFGVPVGYLLGEDVPVTFREAPSPYNPNLHFEVVSLPILETLDARRPVPTAEQVNDYEPVPADRLKGKNHFFLRVRGEDMAGGPSPIMPGYLALVREQGTVADGEIAVVTWKGTHEACLRRVYRADGRVLLAADNPSLPPLLLNEPDLTVFGRVIEIRFKPEAHPSSIGDYNH